jgi:hypothetical protein
MRIAFGKPLEIGGRQIVVLELCEPVARDRRRQRIVNNTKTKCFLAGPHSL